MTHIEQMIQDLCPHGVEWKTLGEVAMRKKGMNITAAQMKKIENINGNIRIFAAGSTKVDVLESDIPASSIIRVPSIIVKSRGNIGFEYYDQPFTHKNEMWSYSNFKGVDIKFVYYYLQNLVQLFQQKARANSVKLPQLCVADTDSFEIPLPPLEIQEKIVECLDKFSALAAELQLRRKQYEYYRTQLLTPHSDGNSANKTDDCNWEWKYLVDVATVQYGYPFEAEKFTDDDSYIPLIRIRDIIPAQASTYYEGTYPPEYIVKKGDILVGMDGNFNLEKWNDRDGLLNQRVCKIFSNDDSIILNDYLYHYLRPEFKKIENEIKGGTVKHLSAARIKQIMVPVPSIKEQCKIADALNLFSKIIQDMEDGIPAEQAAQQKRYEYYRDLLLTFPRKEV